MSEHPIRITVEDDLRRSRLTVFFRLFLAIPHLFWLGVWGFGAFFAGIAIWFATLVQGRPPAALHRFLAGYVRYVTHVNAYLFLAANPFPGFLGHEGTYPVDVKIDGPARQSRLATLFRLFLAIPAFLILLGLTGGGGAQSAAFFLATGGGLGAVASLLGWFAALATGRMPRGLRDAVVYSFRYAAQVLGYVFMLTSRYPDSDPADPHLERPPHPVRVRSDDDPRRSRLTVFFRLPLIAPHLVWLVVWGAVTLVVAVLNWLAALVLGRAPRPFHRFLSAYIRYATHVQAFAMLAANPFPGFTGRAGRYPIDVEIDGPEPQRRLVTLFRLLLALPAFFVGSALGFLLYAGAFLGWFAALVTGRMPRGLRRMQAYSLRYSAQVNAYVYVVTARYPYSGPPA